MGWKILLTWKQVFECMMMLDVTETVMMMISSTKMICTNKSR
jgi:hypothetical protein